MEIKNLFSPKTKASPPEYFLAVEIHDSIVKTAVWQIENELPSVVSVGSFEAWESEDSLVNGLDASLTQAVKHLNVEPDRVIFGLPETWLDGDRIQPEKAGLIKKVTKDLSLKPIGLVTISEAILQQLKVDEGIPPTAIFLEIYPTKVIVSLVRLGQTEKQEEVARSDDLAKDVEEGLVRMESERLPVRFILTDGTDLENEQQQIISYPWQEKLNFLHLPKVEALPPDYSIKAISIAGGAEAAKSLGLGVEDQDPASEPTVDPDVIPVDDATLESIGFSLENDTPPSSQSAAGPEPDFQPEESTAVINDTPVSDPGMETAVPPSRMPHAVIAKTRHFVSPKLPSHLLHQVTFPKFKLPFKSVLLLPIIILFLAGGAVFAYYSISSHADIEIRVAPKTFSEVVPIFLSDTPQADQVTIPTTFRNLDVSVSQTIPTSGETVVGDKSVGQITIYNRSAEPHTLKAGTRIETDSGQAYILDSSVTVASSSAQPEPPFIVTPGSSSASVTAAKIGAEFNLAKGIQFTVDNYPKSILIASADSDFTKGSSRTVKAVSENDAANLLSAANEQIRLQVDSQVQNQDPDQRSVILDTYKVVNKTYSKQPGQEADTVTLDLSVQVPVLTYSHTRLIDSLSDQAIQKRYPNYRLIANQTTVEIDQPQKSSDTTYTANASVNGSLIPNFESANYQGSLAGLQVDKVKSVLEKVGEDPKLTILVSPNLPILNTRLPKNKDRINIKLVAY